MPRFVAFIRGVNVGGKNLLPMADLRRALETAGFEGPQTILQSGTAIAGLPGADSETFRTRFMEVLSNSFSLSQEVVVLGASEWKEAMAANPMPEEAESDGSRFVIQVFPAPPELPEVAPPDRLEVRGRFAYLWHPLGISTSPLFKNRVFQKAISGGTGRNWNTALKVLAALGEEVGRQ